MLSDCYKYANAFNAKGVLAAFTAKMIDWLSAQVLGHQGNKKIFLY